MMVLQYYRMRVVCHDSIHTAFGEHRFLRAIRRSYHLLLFQNSLMRQQSFSEQLMMEQVFMTHL